MMIMLMVERIVRMKIMMMMMMKIMMKITMMGKSRSLPPNIMVLFNFLF